MIADLSPSALGLSVDVASDWQLLRDEWRQLDAACDNYFLSWDWLATWWRHHGRARALHIITVRRHGRLIGALPLYRTVRGPGRMVRLVGAGPSDELGPLCRPEDRAVVRSAIRAALQRLDWNLLLVEDLAPGEEDLVPEASLLRVRSSPVLRFGPGGWDAYLATKSRNFRAQVKRKRQSLERAHALEITLVEEPQDLPAQLDVLFRLHALRWPTGSDFLRAETFHRAAAASALVRHRLRLWIMTLDGRPAAALYGFRCGAVESFYQSGRDPAFERLSVGFTMLTHVMADAAASGVSEYRLLRGEETYKSRFATDAPTVSTFAQTRSRALTRALPRLVAAGERSEPMRRAVRKVLSSGRM